jgi:peroxiredoxin
MAIAVVSRGAADVNRAKAIAHNLENVLLQVDREVSHLYAVESTPSASLVTDGLIAAPLAIGPGAIRALVKRKTMPPPLKPGDRVPSLELRDLTGGTTDLSTLRGQRTLLLFWNPSCGFCKAMLNDIKAWETAGSSDGANMIVISAGSPRANREQGFRSRVLLDRSSDALAVFGADGTPSALVLDQSGRVASEVAVGAPAVLALAGTVKEREAVTA